MSTGLSVCESWGPWQKGTGWESAWIMWYLKAYWFSGQYRRFYFQLRHSKRMGSDQKFVVFGQIMPTERPVGHSSIPAEIPSRSTVSDSAQPWELRGWSCRWKLSQGWSGVKQKMPVSSRASQHLAPAAWRQINSIVSTQLRFCCMWMEVCSSPTCFVGALWEPVQRLCHFFF